MTVEAEGLLSDAFLEGLAQGNQHSVAQLRTVFDSMKNQITRLEANNDKLRSRVKILLHNHAELENIVVDLKAQQSSELEDCKREIYQLQNELEKLRRESIAFSKQNEAIKKGLESTLADKTRILIEMKAENLILKDQLEEQGLQFAQYQSRSEITKDFIHEIRGAIASVQKVQISNQAMLGKFSKQVCIAKQEYLELKTAHEELELDIAGKNSIIESYERKMKELEELKADEQWTSKEKEITREFIANSTNDFRQHQIDMKLRSKKHIDCLYELASFANSELKKLSHQTVEQETTPASGPVQTDTQTNIECLNPGQPLSQQAATSTNSSKVDKLLTIQENEINRSSDLARDNSEFQNDSESRISGDIAVADKENPNDVVLNVSGLFPTFDARM